MYGAIVVVTALVIAGLLAWSLVTKDRGSAALCLIAAALLISRIPPSMTL
ncbi:MAG TPA: hypothetical protein VGJ44_19365 [Kribbellaceae bacterium]